MKKRLLSLLLVMSLCFSVAACGSEDGRESGADGLLTEGSEAHIDSETGGGNSVSEIDDVKRNPYGYYSEAEYGRYSTYDWLIWDLDGEDAEITYRDFAKAVISMQEAAMEATGLEPVNGELSALIGTKIMDMDEILEVSDAMIMLYLAAFTLDEAHSDTVDFFVYDNFGDVMEINFLFSNLMWEGGYGIYWENEITYVYGDYLSKEYDTLPNCALRYVTCCTTPYSGNTIFYHTFEESPDTFQEKVSTSMAVKYLCRTYEAILSDAAPEEITVDEEYQALFDRRREAILHSETTVVCEGTAYYVSAEGDDQNDGKSESTPWRTIGRVMQAASSLKEGDVVYFRRGDSFEGNLNLYGCGKKVTFSAYGTGPKPILLCGSEIDFADADRWELFYEQDDEKIWLYRDSTQMVKNLVFNDGEAFGLVPVCKYIDGKYYSLKDSFKWNPTLPFVLEEELDEDLMFFFTGWDFYKDTPEEMLHRQREKEPGAVMGDLYLRCDEGNPGEVFWEIRGGGYDAGVFMKDGHTLDNLSIRFGLINYPFNNGTVQNCEICYDGGMECFDEENKLYLAGDGLCGEGRNNKVINCYSHDNMDNGIHMEYFSLYDGVYSDMLFEGNLIENCGGGISIAYFAYTADEGQIFNNMICNDNYFVCNNEKCYGFRQRAFQEVIQAFQTCFDLEYPHWEYNPEMCENVRMTNNIFYTYHGRGLINYQAPAGLISFEGNTYVQQKDQLMGMVYDADVSGLWFVGSDYAEDILRYLGDETGKVIVLGAPAASAQPASPAASAQPASPAASAQPDTISASEFEYTVDNGEVTITRYKGEEASVVIPSEMDGRPVTRIGWSAFRSCSSLTSVTIPDGVTKIGPYAFADCSSLTGITIPASVTEIGGNAFLDCSSLTGITIPAGVTKIGRYAFSGCSSLTSVTIPDSVTKIGGSAFLNCSSLTGVIIPDSVTKIGNEVFSGCSSLTGVTIPDSVTDIGHRAFYGCSSLTGVTIPDSVMHIGMYAFYGCSSLTDALIPEYTAVESSTFENCPNLTITRVK